MSGWQALLTDTRQWFRRMRHLEDDRFYSGGFAANLMGLSYDTIAQIFAMMGIGADVIGALRGRWDDPWFLPLGPALLALLIWRIHRGGFRLHLTRIGRLQVDTTSALYFIADAVWLAFAVTWLVHSMTAAPGAEFGPDADFYIGIPLTILLTTALLTTLRVRTLLRDR